MLDRYYDSVPPYRLNRVDKLVAILITCAFFILFLLTCSHQPNIAGDSPELIAGSYSLGIVHPPGYPLYTMVGYVVTHIPLGSVAFRLNFFSAVMHIATLVILFIITLKVTRNRTASVISTSALGLSYLFWFYSLVAEVFPLNNLFAVTLILMAIMVRERHQAEEERKAERLFLFMTFTAGLSLTNHQTIIIVFPALLLFCPRTFIAIFRKPKVMALAIFAFIIGLSPYIYLPVRASQNPYMNFNDPSSLGSFADVVTRRYYGTTRLWRGESAIHRLDLVFDYINTLNREVFLPGIFLGLLGMVQMARKRLGDFLPLISAFLLGGVAFPLLANVRLSDVFHISTIERFYILPTIIFAVFLAMGIKGVLDWLRRVLSGREYHSVLKRAAYALAAFMISLVFFIPAISTLGDVDLSEDPFAESYTNGLLASVEPGSLVFCAGDPPIELIDEYYTVMHDYRGEIITISWSFWGQDWYMENIRKWLPELNIPEDPRSLSQEGDSFEEYRARLAYYAILNNQDIPGFYILSQDPELGEYVQLVPKGMAYKILPKGSPLDFDSYFAFQEAYWNGIDRSGLEIYYYRENRREIYMIGVISAYINRSGKLFYDNSLPMQAADMYKVSLEINRTIETELNLAASLLQLGMFDSVGILYRDAIDNMSPKEPLLWETVFDLEAWNKGELLP